MYFLADQTHRLRGEKSTDHVGAGRRCGEYVGLETMAKAPLFMEPTENAMPILSRT